MLREAKLNPAIEILSKEAIVKLDEIFKTPEPAQLSQTPEEVAIEVAKPAQSSENPQLDDYLSILLTPEMREGLKEANQELYAIASESVYQSLVLGTRDGILRFQRHNPIQKAAQSITPEEVRQRTKERRDRIVKSLLGDMSKDALVAG